MLSRLTNSLSRAARATGNTLTRKTLQNKINRAEAELKAAEEEEKVIKNLKNTNSWAALTNDEKKKRNSQLTKAKEKINKLKLALKTVRNTKAAENFGKAPPEIANTPEVAAIKARGRKKEENRLKTLRTQKTINTPSFLERIPKIDLPKIGLPKIGLPNFLKRSNSKTRNYNCKCTRKNTPVVNNALSATPVVNSASLDLSNQNRERIDALGGGKHKRRTVRRNKRKRGTRRN